MTNEDGNERVHAVYWKHPAAIAHLKKLMADVKTQFGDKVEFEFSHPDKNSWIFMMDQMVPNALGNPTRKVIAAMALKKEVKEDFVADESVPIPK